MAQKWIEIEPGKFRPKGAFGPIVNPDGEVLPSGEWPHHFSGTDKLTTEQQAHLDAVKREAEADQ